VSELYPPEECEWCGAKAGEHCFQGCGPDYADEEDWEDTDLNDSNDWESAP
jgi:hypothetical protein